MTLLNTIAMTRRRLYLFMDFWLLISYPRRKRLTHLTVNGSSNQNTPAITVLLGKRKLEYLIVGVGSPLRVQQSDKFANPFIMFVGGTPVLFVRKLICEHFFRSSCVYVKPCIVVHVGQIEMQSGRIQLRHGTAKINHPTLVTTL